MVSQLEPGMPLASERAKYLEPAAALNFPASADVPETQLHLDLRTLLYQLLSNYLGEEFTVGSDQFVYVDASNPERCIAPDVYVKHAPRGEPIKTWKVWERGAPDVAIEVLSDTDSKPGSWDDKFAFYQACGVKELIAIDLLTDVAQLRVWNRVNEVLAERALDGLWAESLVLGLHWVVAPDDHLRRCLRIATQVDPLVLVPTPSESARAEAQRAQAEAQNLLVLRLSALTPLKLGSKSSKRCSRSAAIVESFARLGLGPALARRLTLPPVSAVRNKATTPVIRSLSCFVASEVGKDFGSAGLGREPHETIKVRRRVVRVGGDRRLR
jgi:Uma2 family endonuclease